jgi:hypothetical protein
MNRRIRFFAAILAGCAVLAPAALGDSAAGPLPPATTPKPAPLKPGPLNPGKSAGVRAAQIPQNGIALVGAGGAIIAVIAVTAGSSGGNGAAQPQSQSVAVTTP